MISRFVNFLFYSLLLLLTTLSPVWCWKKEEFRTCDQTPFCKRARARTPRSCSLTAENISITGGDLTAQLLPGPSQRDPQGQEQQNVGHYHIKPLVLVLSAYQGGILRLSIDEDTALDPPKKRFEVPEVIAPELHDKKLWLRSPLTVTLNGDPGPSSVVCLSDGYEAVVRHSPFEVYVREKNGGRVISFNSHGLFDFEQLRVKKDGEDWEERFRSYTDTRPYGPQSISFDVSFHGAEFVYGIPEHATSFALRPTRGPGVQDSEPYRLFNLDVFEHVHDSPFGLYGSIPFMLSHGKLRGTSGFFWLNAAEMQIDILGSGWDSESTISLPSSPKQIDTLWMTEAGVVDAFFFVGPRPKDVVQQYATVTGTPAMPPFFSIGYHQSRWNYRDEEDVEHVDSKFDEYDIPYDVLWLDIEHTDGKRYFTWDHISFPNPEEMQKKLAGKGRHMVTFVNPHIKQDEYFYLHKEASEKGYYIKDSSGKDYDGWCWPGPSSYPDMLNPKVRQWWSDQFAYTAYAGSTPSLHILNDMNEPSVFTGPEITMARDALHYGGVEHRELHNVYGFYVHMATFDGLVKREDERDRPFAMAMAFFAGSQRHGAVWTGDNTASWDQLKVSISMILTQGLTGISFTGADIGGFFSNPEPELLVRWYQLGAYYPFFRAHAHEHTKRREPWLLGDRNTELIRDAIHIRYALLPHHYTLFRIANMSGIPIMRPLWMEFPDDGATFTIDDAFMMGSSLLVKGIFTKSAKHVSVYLPGDQFWHDLRTGIAYKGGKTYLLEVFEESIPTFQRGGTIIPRKDRLRRSSTQMADDPYTLVIALNRSGMAEGELYADDGRSFEFLNGAFIHRQFVFADGKLTSSNAGAAGKLRFSSNCIIERIILLGHSGSAKKAVIEPSNQEVKIELGPLWLIRSHMSPLVLVLTIRKPNVRISDDWTVKLI